MSKTSLKEIRISQNNAVVGTNATGDVEEKLINTLKNDLELTADDVDDSTSTNRFVQQADKDKLSNIEAGAQVNPTNTEIVSAIDTELGQTDWQTGGTGGSDTAAQVKTKYESNADTNAFTDADESKLDGIEAGAEVNRTGSETVSLIDTELGSTTWQLGGGSSNSNEFIPTSAADLSNVANIGQIACIQTNITLTADLTLAEGIKLKNCGGYLDIGTFTLTGNNTGLEVDSEDIIIDSFFGTIDGTWDTPILIYASNFGAKADGKEYNTGSITSGSTTLTVTGANFTNNDIGNFIAVRGANSGFISYDSLEGQMSLQTTIVSVTNSTTVEVADAATRTATNELVWTGSDNHVAGLNFCYVRNQKSGKLVFTPGIWFHREVDYTDNQRLTTPVDGWVFGQGTDDIQIEAYGATISSIPHNRRRSYSNMFKNTKRYVWKGGNLRGDTRMHNYSGQPLADNGDDFNRLLFISTASYDGRLEDLNFIDVDGNLMSSAGDQQFTNYIKGANAPGFPGVSTMTVGTIDDLTGVVTADVNADTAYTTELIDVSGFQFEDSRIANAERKGKRIYSFSGSSFAGWAGMKTRDYFAFYYDENGNFLRKSGEQRMYDIIRYDDDVKFLRIYVIKPLDIDEVDAQVRSPLNPVGLELNNVHFIGGTGHAISNPPSNLVINRSSFIETKTILPGFSLNGEDQRMALQNQVVQNSIFKDSWTGYLNWVGAVGISVNNNTFYGTSDPNLQRTDYTTALSLNDTRDARAYANHIYNGAVQLGRNTQFNDNIWRGGRLEATANGVDVYNNEMVNVVIRNLPKDADRYPSTFRNNRMTYYKNWGTDLLGDRNMNFQYENLDILFNDVTRVTNLIDTNTVFEDIVLGENDNSMWENADQTEDFGGYIKNMNIRGARQARSVRDFAKGGVYFPYTTYKGDRNYSQSSIVFKKGLPISRTIDNLVVDGWIEFDLDQFSDTDVADEPTITMNSPKITIPEGEFDWANNGSYILATNSKDFNLVINDGLFDLQVASDSNGTYKKWMFLQHFGTTEFNNVTFKSVSAKAIDLNDFPTTLGAITFTDCTFDNVTFTPRNGIDQIITTNSGGGSGINDIVEDTTPQLGGNLDLNSFDIPVSPSQQTAINLKQDNLISGTNIKTINGESLLGSTDIVISQGTNFNGGTITQDLILNDGTNITPTLDLENSNDTRFRLYALNSLSFLESESVLDDTARDLRIKARDISPSTTDFTDFGTNSLRFKDAFFSGNITANEFRKEGGTGTNILLDDGTTVTNNFLTRPIPNSFNTSKTLTINDRLLYSTTNNPTLTIPLETTTSIEPGESFKIVNIASNSSVITIAAEAGVTIVENVGGLTLANQGDSRTLTKILTDTWVLGY